MLVLLWLLNVTLQTAMLLSKLIVLIAVLNLTRQSFTWLLNKLRLLQISNALEIYLFLRKKNDFLSKNKMPSPKFMKKPTAKEQILQVVF
jgi:hypothetical protein